MFSTSNATRPPSNFEALFNAAMADYARQTGQGLLNHPLTVMLDGCQTPEAMLTIFEKQAQAFDQFRNGDPKLIKWLRPVVDGLYALAVSAAICTDAGLTFPPVKAIFSGIGILLSTAKYVRESYDALVDIFECIENFIRRLMIYTEIPLTPAMTEVLVKIMSELLSVLALATKQINQGRLRKYAKKLLGTKDIESVLQRLDRLTLEESRSTAAQTLDVVYGLVNNMAVVMEDGKASTDEIRQTLVLMQELAMTVNKIERDRLQKNFRPHHRGTATWFTRGSTYEEWKSTGSLMWVHSLPGSGKSILCSTIIEDIQDMCQTGLATLAFFYFDFRDAAKQDARSLLSSLLVQLCDQSDRFSEILSVLFANHGRGSRQSSEGALTECLKNMLELPGQGALYLVIDALDECPNSSGLSSPRAEVVKIFKDLLDLGLPHVHLCISSRPEIDIRRALEPFAKHNLSLHDQRGQNEDIAKYVNSVVLSHPVMSKWREEDKKLVIDTLIERGGGMFRWIYCQLETLGRCFPQSIRRALNELPETLDETYERTLLGIDKEKRDYAYRLFQCLTVSVRPLHVEELAELFAIQPNAEMIPAFNVGWRPENAEESILSACSTLIAVVNVDDSQVAQFSHFSVREYLTSNRIATSKHVSHFHIVRKPAHTLLARACLSVLLQLDDRIDNTTIKNFPLASYAAQHWVDHAQFENVSSDIQDGIECLFDKDKPYFSAWIWLYDIDLPQRPYMSSPCPEQPDATPLYYAALCGFLDLTERLVVSRPEYFDALGGIHETPLHAALAKGHLNIALLLLERGADVRSVNLEAQTPLHIATDRGYTRLVLSLIERGADPNAERVCRHTPLWLASQDGRLEIARILLEHGADVNRADNGGRTPLHNAAVNEHDHVARLLLDHGADVNAEDRDHKTPLRTASLFGNTEVVRVLLEYGANVESRDVWGGTPLHYAAQDGYLEVVRSLLDHRADANVRGGDNDETALHMAAESGHLQVVELLLEHGGDPSVRNGKGETPFEVASRQNHLQVARLPLESAGEGMM